MKEKPYLVESTLEEAFAFAVITTVGHNITRWRPRIAKGEVVVVVQMVMVRRAKLSGEQQKTAECEEERRDGATGSAAQSDQPDRFALRFQLSFQSTQKIPLTRRRLKMGCRYSTKVVRLFCCTTECRTTLSYDSYSVVRYSACFFLHASDRRATG